MHVDIYSVFNPPPKDNLTTYDFKVVCSDENGIWIKLDEVRELVANGSIKVDYDKLKEFTDSWRYMK